MTDYTKNANFAAKTGTTIEGADFDLEFDEIATAISSKENTANKNVSDGYAGLDGGGLVLATVLPAATESAKGAVELATNAEVTTGTDTTRAVTPAGLTARLGSGPVGAPTLIEKTASENVVSSTAFQLDDQLLTGTLSAGTYLVEVQGQGSFNSAANGIKFAFSSSGTIRADNPLDSAGLHVELFVDGSTTQVNNAGASYPTTGVAITVTGTPTAFSFRLWAKIVLSTSGTIVLNWAQQTATGTTTLGSGTFMLVRQIA